MSKKHYIIPIFVPHEGCPHNCVFCNQDSITGRKDEVNEIYASNIIDEYLKTIPEKDCTIEVSFFGGTFTAIPLEKQKSLLKVAKKYKDNGRINYIRLSTRPDYIDDEILSNLKAYSVDIIELGVQSLDKEVLFLSGRGHSEEDVIYASNKIKEYGFILGHQIMLGLPGDDFHKDIETTKKVIKLGPSICRIYPSLIIKDTPMEMLYKKGLYNPYTLEEAVEVSKIVYGMLSAHKIKVIRIGLQPTEEINEGKDVIGGPFHAAFRELVESSIYKDVIIENAPIKYTGELIININTRDISKLYANKKQKFNDIKEQLKTLTIKVIHSENVDRGVLILKWENECKILSINECIMKKYKEGFFSNI